MKSFKSVLHTSLFLGHKNPCSDSVISQVQINLSTIVSNNVFVGIGRIVDREIYGEIGN